MNIKTIFAGAVAAIAGIGYLVLGTNDTYCTKDRSGRLSVTEDNGLNFRRADEFTLTFKNHEEVCVTRGGGEPIVIPYRAPAPEPKT